MSQWPKWLRRQNGKLEICGSSPSYDIHFSLKNYHSIDCLFVSGSKWCSQVSNPITIFAIKSSPPFSYSSRNPLHTVFRVSLWQYVNIVGTQLTQFFSTSTVSILCNHSFLLFPLAVKIHSYTVVSQNQVANAILTLRSLCNVRSAAVRKIRNIGVPTCTR